MPCIVDVRDEKQIGDAVEKAVQTFGGEKQNRSGPTRMLLLVTLRNTANANDLLFCEHPDPGVPQEFL